MRVNPTKNIERHRITSGPMASPASYGPNGAFQIPGPDGRALLCVIASDGDGWEHVSVSLRARCPTWEEMDFVKRIFWRDDETVMQLHVPRDRHVNYHEHCLHLWRPTGAEIPLPNPIMVGPIQR